MLVFLLIRNCCYWAGKLAKTSIKASANRLRKSIGVACLVRLAAPAQDPTAGRHFPTGELRAISRCCCGSQQLGRGRRHQIIEWLGFEETLKSPSSTPLPWTHLVSTFPPHPKSCSPPRVTGSQRTDPAPTSPTAEEFHSLQFHGAADCLGAGCTCMVRGGAWVGVS